MAFGYKIRVVLYALPSVVKAVAALSVLPLMTALLNAADYGFFALMVTIANVCAVLPAIGSSVVTTRYFAPDDHAQRSEIMSNMVVMSIAIGLAAGFVCWIAWHVPLYFYPERAAETPEALLILGCLTVVFNGWSVLSSEALTLDRRAGLFATVNILKDLSGSLASVAALYWLSAGANSLFYGFIVTGVAGGVLGVAAMRRYLSVRPTLAAFRKILEDSHIVFAQLFEHGASLVERSVIASGLGLTALGVYNHSRLYETTMMSGTKAISRTAWSRILEDVRRDRRESDPADLSTGFIAALCLLTGLGLGTVGYDIIGLLSHQKFNDASYFAAVWVALISIRITGFIPKAILYTHGQAKIFAIAIYAGQGVMLILLYLLIGKLGILAIVVALAANTVIQRIIVHVGAYRVQPFDFRDYSVIIGVLIVCAAAFISMAYSRNFADRTMILLGFLVFSSFLLLPIYRRIVRFVFHAR
jgi:O-antigen/teichoic acid export membrane protein